MNESEILRSVVNNYYRFDEYFKSKTFLVKCSYIAMYENKTGYLSPIHWSLSLATFQNAIDVPRLRIVSQMRYIKYTCIGNCVVNHGLSKGVAREMYHCI